eukprot:GFUD01015048.1.p1 GENE.GFUD01015048.1~~GFUD01015048.1.p1  ORF type:complete len:350 (+),score=114.99 GFUD01015048.1:122-1171(+)
MLSEKEKHGISELLDSMRVEDLQSLAQTVTSRLLVPENSFEAIQAIILHTDKASDLLKRRKIKKELLFKYLHYKRIPIESISDKSVHVSRVLEAWGSNDSQDLLNIMDSDNSLEGPPPAPVPSRNASHTSLCSLDMNREVLGRVETFNQLRRSGSSNSIMNYDENSSSSFVFDDQSRAATSSSMSMSQCQELAISFVRWYFQLLNSTVESDMTDWSTSHFWPDASAKVSLMSTTGELTECVEVLHNAGEVSTMLVQVFRKYKLKCNPNICEEGVRGKLSPHGLVIVLACGTLHNQHTACGVFEQVFSLIRDPGADNNWKIKQTEARLVGGPVSEVPSITNSQLEAVTFC